MFGFTRDQWKAILVSAVVSVVVGDTLRLIIARTWGANWSGITASLANPMIQVSIPAVFTAVFLKRFRWKGELSTPWPKFGSGEWPWDFVLYLRLISDGLI